MEGRVRKFLRIVPEDVAEKEEEAFRDVINGAWHEVMKRHIKRASSCNADVTTRYCAPTWKAL
jgi:hypothetical protein